MNRSVVAQLKIWLAFLFVGCFLACSTDEEALSGGGLMVVVESDLSMPKDIDHVRLEATQVGTVLFRKDEDVGAGHLLIPARFSIAYPGNGAPVSIRGLAFKDGVARIERSVVTPIPSSRIGMVRMPLDYFCDGTAAPDGKSTCGEGKTCSLGTCITSTIPPSDVPPFGADGGAGGCFDVLPCFAAPTTVTLDIATCSIAVPQGVAAGRMNIALQLPLRSEGICDTKACWIVLNQNVEGWVLDGARIRLPAAACRPRPDGRTPTVAVSSSCSTKMAAVPTCGAWSSGGKPIDPPPPPPTGGAACGGLPSQTCGVRCGTATRVCSNGDWLPWSSCLGEGECTPNAVRTCGTGGTQICGGACQWGECQGEPCPGLPTNSCENCGTQSRTCLSGGRWSDWSSCSGQGMCAPNSTEPCGNGGTRACGGSCQWGVCTGQVCVGPNTMACPNCGTQSRTCDNGTWSDWSPCANQGECGPNATEACGDGGGTRSCGGDCRWSSCNYQPCNGPPTEACGNCGTRTRVCNSGMWSDWSACEMQGACSPNSMQGCGNSGTRSCGGNCQWGQCTGQPCDGPPTQSCGNCGTQSRVCSNGMWSPWSTCDAQGECSPNTTAACGNGGTRSCAGDCHFGPCVQPCSGPVTQACGRCGTQSRVCDPNSGSWNDWSACGAEGPCAPGETQTCGADGKQTCGGNCQWLPDCPGQICPGLSSQDCGSCGKQTRTCDSTTGMWSDWSACSGEGICKPPATQPCGNSGMQTCSAVCTWGPCGDQMCPGLPSGSCGNCGTHVRTCDPNTGNWSDWGECTGQGACQAGSTQVCGSGGSQTCSSTCQWLPACTGQMCIGVPPGQSCGNCGTQTRACDSNTGTWNGDWGACANEGVCSRGATRGCDGGAQTCGDNCQWLPCLTIVVTPIDPSIAAGRTQQFVATGNYAGGTAVDLTSQATWSSKNSAVGTVSNASGSVGLANSLNVGSTIITASYGAATGSATLNVTAAELVSISVAPVDSTIHVGATQKFTATGTYTDSSTKDLTLSVTWAASNNVVATMSSKGLASGVSVGTAVVTASLGSVTGTTRLIVSNAPLEAIQLAPVNPTIAPGTSQPFTATALYNDGTRLDVTSQVSWSSGNAGVATVSNASGSYGVATGLAVGTTTIFATLNTITGSTTLTVSNATLVSIAIAPSNPTIALGASITFTATGSFSDGSTQDITSAAIWTSTNSAVATVSALTGVAYGGSAGTATITASLQMVSGGTSLNVTP